MSLEEYGGHASQAILPEPEAEPRASLSRKDFFRLMGATAVMAGAACRRPTEEIVPAVIQPAEYTPGVARHYASSTPDGTGIVIKTREGRPIKIAGNPEHPLSGGGVSAYRPLLLVSSPMTTR